MKKPNTQSTKTINRCFYCGTVEECTRDHFIPQSKGGTKTVWACALCQETKRDLMPLEFVEYMERHPAVTPEAAYQIRHAVTFLLEKLTQ